MGRYTNDHWRLLRREIAHAFDVVPFYASSPKAPASEDPDAIEAWVATLPPLLKRDVRRGFPKGWTPRGADLHDALAREEAVLIATSGTTEDRVQVLWDAGWWDPQERAAMRLHAGIRETLASPSYREAVLTTPVCAAGVCHIGEIPMAERTLDRILFLNQAADPTHWRESDVTRMADEIDEFKPAGLEADPAYLAALARSLHRSGRRVHQPAFIQLSYEFATEVHRRRIASAFDARPVSLYGSTESGVLFMECEHGRMHANSDHTHADLVPVGDVADGAGRLMRVLATTMGRRWMPLVRFDQGDLLLVRPEREGTPCECGRSDGPIVDCVDGRVGDLTWSARRRPVTSGAIDRALADLSGPDGIDGWQISQASSGDVRARFVACPTSPTSIDAEVVARLTRLYADGATANGIRADRVTAIAPEASGKYRPSWCDAELAAGTRLARDRSWLEARA